MLAVDALGPERVTLVVMPSPHSSAETQEDARQIARNLGTELIDIEIEPMMDGYREALDVHLRPEAEDAGDSPTDPTRPARARPGRREHPGADPRQPDDGAVEPARLAGADDRQQERDVGRLRDPLRRHGGRLRGDQGRAEDARLRAGRTPQRDAPGRELVPAAVIERPPSAELRPDQLDSDSLPDYDLLDRILEAYVEGDKGRDEMVAAGLPGEVVDEVIRLVDRSEYKRRQAAPGIRITPKAFGRDRRLPITNRFGG